MADVKAKILIVDDETNIHYSFEKILGSDYDIASAQTAEDGLLKLEKLHPDVVVMDIKMPGMNGLEALKRMRDIDGRVPVVMMTAHGSMDTAIKAMKYGAFEYLLKPFDIDRMREVIQKAFQSSQLMRRSVRVASGKGEKTDISGDMIVGTSEAMQEVYKLIGQVAAQDVTVLIRGDSGTGKELVARAIYHHSRRAKAPFLEVNCAALPENLLESELFGYEKGAFTGATERRIGKFEQVDGGTLFLDEIGEMSLVTQAKILRVIQYGEFNRVGGNTVIRNNVRLLAATNRNLEEMIKKGEFREDLYYRLNVITVPLPELQERKEDIPQLIEYFLARYGKDTGRSIQGVDKKAMNKLMDYAWPGNVRQLENCIRRAMVLAKGVTITAEDLELEAVSEEALLPRQNEEDALDAIIDQIVQGSSQTQLWPEMEKRLIEKVLVKTRGNQVQAARVLGIHRNTLRNRIDRYGLNALISGG